ncbi:MAG: class I SAM-dependent methyltransferase [Eubacteriales bacterium]|nr:class I SAM-dependent methyltransferase [Eubacteriales bacterium]
MNQTLQFYQQNIEQFAAGTVAVDFSGVADRFLHYLPTHAKILDYGCGSGRDTRYFLERGYAVDAIDGSRELCDYATAYTGIPVRCMLFQELDAVKEYDGIWACASILHVAKAELPEIFRKMIRALKPGGMIYISFKYGEFEGVRNQRYFTDFTLDSFKKFKQRFPELEMVESWITGDVRPERSEEKWLNLILRRSDIR